MRQLRFVWVGLILVALLSSIYISCGGGGGGSSSSSSGTSYTPATISEDNLDKTVTFFDETIPFCSMGSSAGMMSARLYSLAALGQDITDQVKLVKLSDRKAIAADDTASDEETLLEGDCGGTVTMTLAENDADSNVSGSIEFNNFCSSIEGDTETSELRVNGTASLAGSSEDLGSETERVTFEVDTSEAITIVDGTDTYSIAVNNAVLIMMMGDSSSQVNFTLSDAVITEGNDRYTIKNVSMGLSMTEVSEYEDRTTITINSLTLEENTSEASAAYQLQGVSMVVVDSDTQSTLSVSGTYIDGDEGAVTISTPTAVTVDAQGDFIAGNIVVTGADDTRVSIEPTGENLFNIQADTDGDGSYDYLAGTMDCSSFDPDDLF